MKPVVENIYAVSGLMVGRVYVIKGQDGLTVIDSSVAANTADKLEKQLQAIGFSLKDVRYILITHAHPDHIGGLVRLQQLTDARTAVHFRDADIVRGKYAAPVAPPADLGFFGKLMRKMAGSAPPPSPARVDIELKGGDHLDDILPGLEVIELHGHSEGQVGYWWPEKRLLIGGDVMMRMPWGLTQPLGFVSPDIAGARRSIQKVAAMDVDVLCLGHGAPIVGHASEAIRAFAKRVKL